MAPILCGRAGTDGANTVIYGVMAWTGGEIGVGSSLTIASNAVLNITGGGHAGFAWGFDQCWTVNWLGTGDLEVLNSPENGYTGGSSIWRGCFQR